MKKMMWFLLMMLVSMSLQADSQALVDELKGSAYSHAMGMTISSRSKDALSIFWNPGLLGNYEKIHADVVRVSLLDLATSYSAGVVIPVERGLGIGFAINQKSTQKMEPAQIPGATRSQNSDEQLFLLALGKELWRGLSVGVSMKAVQQQYGNQVSNRAFGADMGITYRMDRFGGEVMDRTILSAAIENIARPHIEFGVQQIILPRFYQLGFEKTLDIPGGNLVMLASLYFTDASQPGYRFGFEYAVGKIGKAAIGWDEGKRLCLGGGIQLGEFQLSAAHIYTNYAGYYSLSIGYSVRPAWLIK